MLKLLPVCAGVALGLFGLSGLEVHAQNLEGCVTQTLSDPPRQSFTCGDTLVIELEATDPNLGVFTSQASPITAIEISERAVLIEVEPGAEGFQILTPHAIASVRGTEFVVVAGAQMTSVFVRTGQVEVADRQDEGHVVLEAGDGIEVTPDEPLVVKHWPDNKVADLLARFGR